MKKYLKFLKKLDSKIRNKVVGTMYKISINDLEDLDIKKLSDKQLIFRCRIGQIRIIFRKIDAKNIICNIGFRKDVY